MSIQSDNGNYPNRVHKGEKMIMTFKGHKVAILTAFLCKTPKFGYNGDFRMKFWHLIPIGGGYKIWFVSPMGLILDPSAGYK